MDVSQVHFSVSPRYIKRFFQAVTTNTFVTDYDNKSKNDNYWYTWRHDLYNLFIWKRFGQYVYVLHFEGVLSVRKFMNQLKCCWILHTFWSFGHFGILWDRDSDNGLWTGLDLKVPTRKIFIDRESNLRILRKYFLWDLGRIHGFRSNHHSPSPQD